ncbi:MetQ/NlpA family ABC transporter substrate-binding protein [Oligella urethralis]|uniref:MetQ/NlpA family ABC transporter substrate-binding protein n=1 Tax=Oligella urethralis TaxID=90245 RepID=UPI0003771DE4|nr:MetQ/NlpA family ABC transporter substrate-binding protein [Oligella urethralis]SUA56334.1 29 kDa protein [Oligella urethralis]SUA69280.1 29 kDa protein [Oligella urethralis]
MKLTSIFSALALTAAVALQPALAADKLSIAATPVPHAEILEHIKPALKEAGVDLDIKVFTDYVQPNQQVADGQIDANFFQHKPYLDSFNKERGTDLVSVGLVHVEPFGAYSKKIDNIENLKEGARVAIPNDPSNGARGLLLLEKNGLIKLKDPENLLATSRDVSENPKQLKFTELEAATLARVLDDVDLALINTNYAIEAGLNPLEDALIIEGSESPYANLVAVKAGNEKDGRVEKLLKALQSEDVKKFIADKYKGAVVPAF